MNATVKGCLMFLFGVSLASGNIPLAILFLIIWLMIR